MSSQELGKMDRMYDEEEDHVEVAEDALVAKHVDMQSGNDYDEGNNPVDEPKKGEASNSQQKQTPGIVNFGPIGFMNWSEDVNENTSVEVPSDDQVQLNVNTADKQTENETTPANKGKSNAEKETDIVVDVGGDDVGESSTNKSKRRRVFGSPKTAKKKTKKECKRCWN